MQHLREMVLSSRLLHASMSVGRSRTEAAWEAAANGADKHKERGLASQTVQRLICPRDEVTRRRFKVVPIETRLKLSAVGLRISLLSRGG